MWIDLNEQMIDLLPCAPVQIALLDIKSLNSIR